MVAQVEPMPIRYSYFMGVDPAPAFDAKADDGALVAAKAWPRVPGELSSSPADWHFGYVWAYRLRAASLEEWSGFIHKKHREFGFTKIVLDVGAGGGGGFIRRQLQNHQQLIEQVPTKVKPIVTTDDTVTYDGYPILHMTRRKDPGIATLFPPPLDGDDVLIDAIHTGYRQVLDSGSVGFPRPHDEVAREVSDKWPEEMQWASKNLSAVRAQLVNVQVATNPDGTWQYTNRGAKQFSAIGKKDLAYAAVYCHLAFRIWLAVGDFSTPDPDDDAGFSGF